MKDYRKNELIYYALGNILIMLFFSGQLGQILTLNNETQIDIFKVVTESVFVLSIVSSYVFVLDSVLSGWIKFKIAYFGIGRLPGCTIFSKIKEKDDDPRFDHEDVMKCYEQIYLNMPEKNKRKYENVHWNKIYLKDEKEDKVKTVQRNFLLCRDLFIMTLFLCIIYFILIVGCEIGVLRYEVLIVLMVELLATNIAMREQGIEFAYMVIALDVNQVRAWQK